MRRDELKTAPPEAFAEISAVANLVENAIRARRKVITTAIIIDFAEAKHKRFAAPPVAALETRAELAG